MAGDTDNPRVWLNGDVFVADVGSTAPTNLTDDWPAAWSALGLLSEDGLTTSEDSDSSDLYAWGGIKIRTIRSKFNRLFVVTALEDTPVVFGLVHPGSSQATATGVTTRTVRTPTTNIKAFGFQMSDGPGITRRLIVPRGEVTNVGEVKASDSELTMFELTVAAYPAANGDTYLEITNDPAAVVV